MSFKIGIDGDRVIIKTVNELPDFYRNDSRKVTVHNSHPSPDKSGEGFAQCESSTYSRMNLLFL